MMRDDPEGRRMIREVLAICGWTLAICLAIALTIEGLWLVVR